MSRNVGLALYAFAMVALIVAIDLLALRHHVWLRLTTNVGIVALFIAVYAAFLREP